MIDIHNHIIYGVDDGPRSLEESIEILKEAEKMGISDIIATSHFRKNFFYYKNEDLINNFNKLKKAIANESISINLHLGHEAYLDNDLLNELLSGNCFTLAGSQYVLVELPSIDNFFYIQRLLFDLANNNYIPIIAHVDRLIKNKSSYNQILKLKKMGCFLQVNASALLVKIKGLKNKKWLIKQLKNENISFIASDSHRINMRKNRLLEVKKNLSNKIDSLLLNKIFYENPKRVIENKSII